MNRRMCTNLLLRTCKDHSIKPDLSYLLETCTPLLKSEGQVHHHLDHFSRPDVRRSKRRPLPFPHPLKL